MLVFILSPILISALDSRDVIYLKFESTNGTYLIDETENFKPIDGHNRNIIKNIIVNNSLYLDNSNSCYEQIRIPLGKSVEDTSEGYKKSIWKQTNPIEDEFTIESYVVLFDKRRQPLFSEIDGQEPLIEFLENNKIRINVDEIHNISSGTAGDFYFESKEALIPQKVYHVALVYNKPYIQIWINGEKDSQKKIKKLKPFLNSKISILGRARINGGWRCFYGLIDEFKITEEAKTDFDLNTSILLKEITREQILKNIENEKILKEESVAWKVASEINTTESYVTYLSNYPNSTYSTEAESMAMELEGLKRMSDIEREENSKIQKEENATFEVLLLLSSFLLYGIFFIYSTKKTKKKNIEDEKKRIENSKLLRKALLKNRRKRIEDKKEKERERKENEEQKVKFEKSQKSKGLVQYENKWMTKNEKETEERIDAFILKMEISDKYKGAYMRCRECGYVWKIKKDFGLPARCNKCNSHYIKIDKRKSYYN